MKPLLLVALATPAMADDLRPCAMVRVGRLDGNAKNELVERALHAANYDFGNSCLGTGGKVAYVSIADLNLGTARDNLTFAHRVMAAAKSLAVP